ncbi:MAG: type II secretion system F family protein [Desulfovibrio sp.]|nr:type II secretion system F family protein [Desulfovibrio sp.]
MPQFAYSCLDSRGKTRKGSIDAPSRQVAVSRLRAEGLTPYEVGLSGGDAGTSSVPFWKRRVEWRKRIPKTATAAMVRQLATLLKAGLPLDRALYVIYSGDVKSPMSRVAASLHETILGGKDFAQALSMHPGVFSQTFVAMIRAAESSGALDLVMERLAGHLEQEVAMRRKVRSALAYPVFMLVVGLAVVIFLLSFVIPQVTRIFADMGRELPGPTRVLLAISDSFRVFWPLLLAGLVLIATLLWRVAKSEKGRRFIQAGLFRAPLIGDIYARSQQGNFSRTLGMLLKNGVPLLQSLRVARAASSSMLVNESVDAMIEGAQQGRELSAFMSDETIYTPIARQMVAAGEKSGRLAEMLLWVADDSDDWVGARLQSLASLLEPAMILVLGCLVGFVVIAIILPIFEMSSLAG